MQNKKSTQKTKKQLTTHLSTSQLEIIRKPEQKIKSSLELIKALKRKGEIKKMLSLTESALSDLRILKTQVSASNYYHHASHLMNSVIDLLSDSADQCASLLLIKAKLEFENGIELLTKTRDMRTTGSQFCFNALHILLSLQGTTVRSQAKSLLNEYLKTLHNTIRELADITLDFLDVVCLHGYQHFITAIPTSAKLEDYQRNAICDSAEFISQLAVSLKENHSHQRALEILNWSFNAMIPLLQSPNRDKIQHCVALSKVLKCYVRQVLCYHEMKDYKSASLVYEHSKQYAEMLNSTLQNVRVKCHERDEISQELIFWQKAEKFVKAPDSVDFETAMKKIEAITAEMDRAYEYTSSVTLEDLIIHKQECEELINTRFQPRSEKERDEFQRAAYWIHLSLSFMVDSLIDKPKEFAECLNKFCSLIKDSKILRQL